VDPIESFRPEGSDATCGAVRSLYIRRAPEILTIQLQVCCGGGGGSDIRQRVVFDRNLNAPVKLHTPFSFPHILDLDRWMEECPPLPQFL
jgi:hypothetical protein